MIDLSSRGLPQRPDQNPLAQRRETMAGQNNPMAQQLAQADALRQDPSGLVSPQAQGLTSALAPNATMQQQPGGMGAPSPLAIQQQQRQQAAQMRGRF